MIKMYINNEEVVSNKEFTISEEMLATPSTVLNNCYPALWENTKDYVSKFYFPKDYSKCIIGDGEFEKGSQRNIIKKVSGISPSFETNITKPWESLTIDGNSYQATSTDPVSPSPDYPSEIENVKGKNLFAGGETTTNNGITFTKNEDGTYNIKGTATAQANCYNFVDIDKSNIVNGKIYTLWQSFKIPGVNILVEVYNGNTWVRHMLTSITLPVTNIANISDGNRIRFAIRVAKDITVDVKNLQIQLEQGSIATRYVPYGNIQIVETGENLFNPAINFRESIGGLTNTLNPDGSITISGKPTYDFVNIVGVKDITDELEDGKVYTLSQTNKQNKFFAAISAKKSDGTTTYFGSGSGRVSITINKSIYTKYLIYVEATSIANWGDKSLTITSAFQLEKGSTATNYEPYTEEVVNIDLKGNELTKYDKLIIKDGRATIQKKSRHLSSAIKDMNNGEDYPGWRPQPELLKDYPNKNGSFDNVPTSYMTNISNSDFSVSLNTNGNIGIIFLSKGVYGLTQTQWKEKYPDLVFDLIYELAEPYEIDLGEVTLPNTLIGQNNVTLKATLETNMEISYYYSSYDLLFAGVVKKTGNISLNPRYPHYADIQVLDFKTFLSEGETLNFVIDNKTIGQAIDMVIDAIKSYGFIKGNIMLDDINEVIGAYSTDKKTAYDVFQYFSDITNSRWFTRMIDEDTVAIDFYDTDKLPVKPKIEYTEDWFCNNLIDDMSYSIKTDDYRNKQILLSDEVFGSTPYNDLLTSNGYDTSYTTTGKVASLTSAKIDGKDATFTTEANKEDGVEADIYYKPGEVGITTNNQIGAGKVIEITYIPLVEGREIIINDEEVNRIGSQLNRNGVISRYENRNDTTSSDELRQIGQTYIKYKGKAEVTLKITSRKNIYDIGDKVQFDAPLEDLSTEYMVKKKTTKYIVTANQLFYDYELSSSFNSESEINYFDNQRSKHKGNLSEGDYITRDIDITNSANIIWHDTSIDELSITGNNILDCALDSPFTD